MVARTETLGGSFEDVRALCAVVELGTVSAAAEMLGETKGSVSRRLSRLEGRLGVALLARTPRAVTPTEEGRSFYVNAREALTWLDDATEAARQSRSRPHGHLRVTAPVDLGMHILPDVIVRFRAVHPQITIELLLTDTALDLASNRIDLALRVPIGTLPDMAYRASPVIEYQVCLYASPAYLAARGEPSHPADLIEHDLLAVQEFSDGAQLLLSDPRGRTERVVARPVIRTTDYASLLGLAIADGGIAPLPELVSAAAAEAGALVRVLPEWQIAEVKLYAISLRGREAPARVTVFRDFMRAELTKRLRESRRGQGR